MSNKKFLRAAALSLAVLFTACSAGGTGVTETVSETVSETAVAAAAETTAATTKETTVTTTETTTEATTEATAEIIDTSGVEYMKEALQAEWDDGVSSVNLYTEDLNGDGVKELFVNYTLGVGQEGILYVYDVSDGTEKLYDISARIWAGNAKMYKDENDTVHFILQANYTGSVWQCNHAYFDITRDSIKMPFYIDVHGWFDGGAHIFDDNIYKNCEVVPYVEEFGGYRNFDIEKAEFIGKYDALDIRKAFEDGESNEVSEIIQKEVFGGMTYLSDVTDIYFGSSYNGDTKRYEIEWDFEEFWQEAAPKLAEVYSK